MAWLALDVRLERAHIEALGDALLETGAQSVTIDVDEDAPAALHALFAEGANALDALAAAAARCGTAMPDHLVVRRLEDADWVRSSQVQFEPLAIGARLWIGASWHTAPAAAACVRIDPGLAFGTGSHPSTRLCLEFLVRTLRGGERVLDYGCGSGILAIAAAKLGATRVDAVDIDVQAIEVTRDNAAANGVQVRACLADALAPGDFDVVVANILAQPLVALAPVLAARCAHAGRIALAGLLDAQGAEVSRAYAAAGIEVSQCHEEEGWVLLEGLRR